ncbi:MAG: hypothetical protein N2508_15050 [Anaerolineae bacterium]|nr:hypothetical protein [Anaerolineae bacterium]
MQVHDTLEERIKLAVQSLLENESLTGDLDDEAAQTLLDWGIACVRRIVLDTGGLDDEEAAAVMSPRLRATRRLMRRVNAWLATPSPDDRTAILFDIAAQAAIIYGTGANRVDEHRLQAMASLQPGGIYTRRELIARLRGLFDPGKPCTLPQDDATEPLA